MLSWLSDGDIWFGTALGVRASSSEKAGWLCRSQECGKFSNYGGAV
jgi:hypothetical protein